MLTETHPLYKAELLLLLLFEKAPEDHQIEFRAIRTKDKSIHIEAVPIKVLEQSFDFTLADWIMKHSKQGYDVYFGVCPREKIRRGSKGAPMGGRSEDVKIAVCAWMDYDKSTWQEVMKNEPTPTFVVTTGHGAHFYYKYPEPVQVEKATSDSKDIAQRFGGDSTYDAARILRVPGTRNWKDPEKELIATLQESDPEVIFSGKVPMEDGEPKKARTVMDLPWDLRNLIVAGYGAAVEPFLATKPEDGTVNRSAVDARVMTHLFMHGFSEEKIRDVFQNPDYGISGKVLEDAKRGNAENYLQRTIDYAKLEYQRKSVQHEEIGDTVVFETLYDLGKAPPLEFAVQRLLPVGGLLTISGASKIGKSMSVTELALLLAGAKSGPFLGFFGIQRTGTVAYCQAEVSRSSLDYRLATICDGMKVENWRALPLRVFNRSFDLTNSRHLNAITNSLKKMKADFFVVDPLARFHCENENRQREMALVLRNLQRIGQDAGVLGTILVHHFGKPGDNERSGVHMIRGASVIGDWGNSHMLMNKKFNETTGKKYVELEFELRDAEEPPRMTMALNRKTFRFEPYELNNEHLPIVKAVIDRKDLNATEQLEQVVQKTGLGPGKARTLIRKVKREVREGFQDEGKAIPVAYEDVGEDDDE